MATPSTGLPERAEPDNTNSVVLSAARTRRKGAGRSIYNASDKQLAVGCGFVPGTVEDLGTTGATIVMEPDGYFEVPFGFGGVIYGRFESGAVGSAYVTTYA